MLFLVLTTVMAITAISNSSQNMNEVAAGGVKPKRSNSRGVRIVGSRIYDSANGNTYHLLCCFSLFFLLYEYNEVFFLSCKLFKLTVNKLLLLLLLLLLTRV